MSSKAGCGSSVPESFTKTKKVELKGRNVLLKELINAGLPICKFILELVSANIHKTEKIFFQDMRNWCKAIWENSIGNGSVPKQLVIKKILCFLLEWEKMMLFPSNGFHEATTCLHRLIEHCTVATTNHLNCTSMNLQKLHQHEIAEIL
ncbi:uncharacterized protein [Spinacia oleracea]|uniref:Uncharacterized protein isoform X1 n=1 Tax=Spinacia oleracea TaxID=3562 RepID=A0A9R0K1S1_SPIOL|nr:uncharacterized protein LOC110793959 isoform X1 [Spinacia oleracea]